MHLSDQQIRDFRQTVCDHYAQYGRSFPWRPTGVGGRAADPIDPYRILVSEVMLQQTQADRVVPKYEAFLDAFPTIQDLATARLADVLALWQGLGYNRRARHLKQAAERVVRECDGRLPDNEEGLVTLPGIGPYTAAAIVAFAANRPAILIETNIRSVYLHFFFPEAGAVDDRELLPLIQQTLDLENPREWYQALMDYGAMLKKQGINPARRSKHYARQAPLKGSSREARGAMVRELVARPGRRASVLALAAGLSEERAKASLQSLADEGMVRHKGGRFYLAE